MIVYWTSADLFVASLTPSDSEFDGVCHALKVDSRDLTVMFVTIHRGPLDEEMLHAKITKGQRELLDAGSQEKLPF